MQSPKLTYRAYNSGDFAQFDLLDDEKGRILDGAELLSALAFDCPGGTFTDPFELMGASPANRFCGIAFYDGKPFLLSGYLEIAPGVYQTFVIPDKSALKRPKLFHKIVLEIAIKWLQGFTHCRRLQTFSLPLPRIEAWNKALGFVCEGDVSVYTETGESYKLWAKVKTNGVW